MCIPVPSRQYVRYTLKDPPKKEKEDKEEPRHIVVREDADFYKESLVQFILSLRALFHSSRVQTPTYNTSVLIAPHHHHFH